MTWRKSQVRVLYRPPFREHSRTFYGLTMFFFVNSIKRSQRKFVSLETVFLLFSTNIFFRYLVICVKADNLVFVDGNNLCIYSKSQIRSFSVSTRKTKRLNEIMKNICDLLFLNIDFLRNNGYNNSRIISRGAL